MSRSTVTSWFLGYRPIPSVNYIKRVVGLPGDVVDYDAVKKRITLNGKPVPMELIGQYDDEPDMVLGREQLGMHDHQLLLARGLAESWREVRGSGRALLRDGRQPRQ